MIQRAFEESAVFNIAAAIRDQLTSAGPLFQRPPWFRIGVRGQLSLQDFATNDVALADCTFIASNQWRSTPLAVFCHAPWVRREADWHAGPNGLLCYEFDERWAAQVSVAAEENEISDAAAYAAMWCANGTRKLLEKHLLADRLNIAKWRSEWDAWPHGHAAAAREYARELKRAS